jgi:hypothetical protein
VFALRRQRLMAPISPKIFRLSSFARRKKRVQNHVSFCFSIGKFIFCFPSNQIPFITINFYMKCFHIMPSVYGKNENQRKISEKIMLFFSAIFFLVALLACSVHCFNDCVGYMYKVFFLSTDITRKKYI